MPTATSSLTEQEMVDILEDLARNSSSATARIAAIRELRSIGAGEKPVADGFAALDGPTARVGARLKAV
jgi:hypothetical protein